MCPYTRSSAAPHSAKKRPHTRQKIFKKIYSGFRVFAYRVRKPRPRQRDATPPPPEAKARPENGRRQTAPPRKAERTVAWEILPCTAPTFTGWKK
nr:MAG TPA: hypothetical protein [Caudoviricetes sp.]